MYANECAYLPGTLSAASPVSVSSGAVFDLAGAHQTIASLSDGVGGGGTVTNSGSAATLVLATSGSASFSGAIRNGAGTVALIMDGTGTQVLSGSSNYSGGTTIQSGVLGIAHDYNLGAASGPLAITGGTLQVTRA